MARFNLTQGKELSHVGSALYDLAVGKLSNFPTTSQEDLENRVTANLDSGGKTVRFVYDSAGEVFIVVPDLSVFSGDPTSQVTSGREKFANEALGFVVLFGCGP